MLRYLFFDPLILLIVSRLLAYGRRLFSLFCLTLGSLLVLDIRLLILLS